MTRSNRWSTGSDLVPPGTLEDSGMKRDGEGALAASRPRRLLARLLALPALAVATVIVLSLLTLIELGGPLVPSEPKQPAPGAPEATEAIPPDVCPGVVASEGAPALDEASALARLPERASPAVVAMLWGSPQHHERLRELTLEPMAPEPARVEALRRFLASDDPEDRHRALLSARALLGGSGTVEPAEGPLRLLAQRVLSTAGSERDLALLDPRRGESPQAARNRTVERARLAERLAPRRGGESR